MTSPQRFHPLLESLLADVSLEPMRRGDAIAMLAELVAEQVEEERRRCARLCRDRATKWRTTSLAQSTIAAAREEARARANEATYLADLLESGQSLAT